MLQTIYCIHFWLLLLSLVTSFADSYLDESYKISTENVQATAMIDDMNYLSMTLNQILKPRVVGTIGHEEVKQFITNELESMNFHVDQDIFTETVPKLGQVTFTNIVGKLNANADAYLALACHYDSKYFPEDPGFVGAIDSAVPCAIMLTIAKTLLSQLNRHRSDISLMLIFFDGEEAIDEWTATDSLYGSRNLANKLSNRAYLKKVGLADEHQIRDIDRIEVLVLLDLIGAANPQFSNFYSQTSGLHSRLVEIERTLFRTGLMTGNQYMFLAKNSYSSVDDDHRPFLEKNVPILHLITTPFPAQWHKPTDDFNNLDAGSISNFNKVLRVFVYEYLQAHQPVTNFRI